MRIDLIRRRTREGSKEAAYWIGGENLPTPQLSVADVGKREGGIVAGLTT